MREQFLQQIEMPVSAKIIRNLPKKVFYEQADFSKAERELFTSDVESIYLIGAMNQQTMQIAEIKSEEYVYAEIDWIYVKLRAHKQARKITQLLHKSLPNPLVCIIESHQGKWQLSAAHKRLNKNSASKTIVEEVKTTDWMNLDDLQEYDKLLEALKSKCYPQTNLFDVYDHIFKSVHHAETIELIGKYVPNNTNSTEYLAEIQQIQTSIDELAAKQKSSIDFAEKMQLHMQIKKKEQKMESFKKLLEEMD